MMPRDIRRTRKAMFILAARRCCHAKRLRESRYHVATKVLNCFFRRGSLLMPVLRKYFRERIKTMLTIHLDGSNRLSAAERLLR